MVPLRVMHLYFQLILVGCLGTAGCGYIWSSKINPRVAGIKDGSAEGDLGLWVQAHLQRLSEASNGSQKQWQGEVRVGSPQIIGFDTQAYGAVYRSTVEVRLRIEERGQVVWAQTLQQGAVWSRRSSLVNTESARRQALKVAVELAVQTLWQHAQD